MTLLFSVFFLSLLYVIIGRTNHLDRRADELNDNVRLAIERNPLPERKRMGHTAITGQIEKEQAGTVQVGVIFKAQ